MIWITFVCFVAKIGFLPAKWATFPDSSLRSNMNHQNDRWSHRSIGRLFRPWFSGWLRGSPKSVRSIGIGAAGCAQERRQNANKRRYTAGTHAKRWCNFSPVYYLLNENPSLTLSGKKFCARAMRFIASLRSLGKGMVLESWRKSLRKKNVFFNEKCFDFKNCFCNFRIFFKKCFEKVLGKTKIFAS